MVLLAEQQARQQQMQPAGTLLLQEHLSQEHLAPLQQHASALGPFLDSCWGPHGGGRGGGGDGLDAGGVGGLFGNNSGSDTKNAGAGMMNAQINAVMNGQINAVGFGNTDSRGYVPMMRNDLLRPQQPLPLQPQPLHPQYAAGPGNGMQDMWQKHQQLSLIHI